MSLHSLPSPFASSRPSGQGPHSTSPSTVEHSTSGLHPPLSTRHRSGIPPPPVPPPPAAASSRPPSAPPPSGPPSGPASGGGSSSDPQLASVRIKLKHKAHRVSILTELDCMRQPFKAGAVKDSLRDRL